MPKPTIDTLLARVYRHYPWGIETGEQAHHHTEESHRLMCLQEAAANSCEWNFYEIPDEWRVAIDPEIQPVVDALRCWRSFTERWKREFPHYPLWDESNPWHDASYRYSAQRQGYVPRSKDWRDPVVLAVSVLAPVYVIYTLIDVPGDFMKLRYSGFPERYRERVAGLSSLAEEMFGFHRLDEETVRTPVPGVTPFGSNKPLDQTTLMDCLFTTCP